MLDAIDVTLADMCRFASANELDSARAATTRALAFVNDIDRRVEPDDAIKVRTRNMAL